MIGYTGRLSLRTGLPRLAGIRALWPGTLNSTRKKPKKSRPSPFIFKVARASRTLPPSFCLPAFCLFSLPHSFPPPRLPPSVSPSLFLAFSLRRSSLSDPWRFRRLHGGQFSPHRAGGRHGSPQDSADTASPWQRASDPNRTAPRCRFTLPLACELSPRSIRSARRPDTAVTHISGRGMGNGGHFLHLPSKKREGGGLEVSAAPVEGAPESNSEICTAAVKNPLPQQRCSGQPGTPTGPLGQIRNSQTFFFFLPATILYSCTVALLGRVTGEGF